jgi:hypothetical protein
VFQAIALFNANQHEEAILLVEELIAACPNVDPLGCRVVEVSIIQPCSVIKTYICNSHIKTYLRVQLGTKALDGAHYDDAADHFTAAVNSDVFSSKGIHETFGEFTIVR